MEKEIAIIIPAYNAHDTIVRAISSISIQTIIDKITIIIIDDNSKQDYNYLLKYFNQLDLIIIRLEENFGPGKARNIGIEQAIKENLKYIVFLDSDDIFATCTSLAELYYRSKNNKSDFVQGAFIEETGQDELNQLCKTEVPRHDWDIWLFAKLYKTEIINKYKIRFPETGENEDVIFNAHYYLHCKTCEFIDKILYIWKENKNSITRKDPEEYLFHSMKILIKSFVELFHKLQKDDISDERIKSFVINRMLRLYGEYTKVQSVPYLTERIKEWDESLKLFYKEIYSFYENDITLEDLTIEWKDIGFCTSFIPNITVFDFIKKIKGEI